MKITLAFADAEVLPSTEEATDAQLLSLAKPLRHSQRVVATAASTPQILVGGSLDPIAEEQEEACSPDTDDAPAQDALPLARKDNTAALDIAMPTSASEEEDEAPNGTLLRTPSCKIFLAKGHLEASVYDEEASVKEEKSMKPTADILLLSFSSSGLKFSQACQVVHILSCASLMSKAEFSMGRAVNLISHFIMNKNAFMHDS